MYERVIKLGNCRIALQSERVFDTEKETNDFAENYVDTMVSEKPEFRYLFQQVEEIKIPQEENCIQWGPWFIYGSGKNEKRIRRTDDENIPYMCYSQIGEKEFLVQYIKQIENLLGINRFTLSFMALEQRMLARQGVILHCSFVEYKGYGILFSAPSGTGKSTQADLWRQYRECRIINGDRALIQKQNGEFKACGWPICGSSEISENTCVPIKAIVQLSQGTENDVTVESKRKQMQRLVPEVTANRWNTESYMQVLDIVEDMLEQLPIIHYSCDISEEAVQKLETYLFSDEI